MIRDYIINFKSRIIIGDIMFLEVIVFFVLFVIVPSIFEYFKPRFWITMIGAYFSQFLIVNFPYLLSDATMGDAVLAGNVFMPLISIVMSLLIIICFRNYYKIAPTVQKYIKKPIQDFYNKLYP